MNEYSDDLEELAEKMPALGDELKGFTSLEHILAWLPAKGIPLSAIDIVTQDEFCHDLILPVDDQVVLSFGMT